jgi:2-amino-4-hydroxy-6-hydroxymethyldihydropteridine diphosphokinase
MRAASVHRAYVGIGSNLRDPLVQVRAAIVALGAIDSTRVSACSSLYRSTPVGFAEQPDFINAVAALDTVQDARSLLDCLLAIEQARGRERTLPNGPRVLDLDLLLFDDVRVGGESLTVPHPRMHVRAFVLIPLIEIAPRIIVPGHGSAVELLARVEQTGIERIGK